MFTLTNKNNFLICLFFIGLNQVFAQIDFRSDGFGIYKTQKTSCLSDTHRKEIKKQLDRNKQVLKLPQNQYRDKILFSWPLKPTKDFEGFSYFTISNFVDHNKAFPRQVEDFNCGKRTYDTPDGYNHSGTDIALWPFAWELMEGDIIEVVAAAAGTIIGKEDGHFDKSCSLFNTEPWNAIYIEHADGTTAWYGHMKTNSLTPKNIGASIERGEYLGIVGSSGSSTAPHLHFEVYNAFDELLDPFVGACNGDIENSLWEEQVPYINSAINKLEVSRGLPSDLYCSEPSKSLDTSEFCTYDELFFISYLRDIQKGQILYHKIVRPDNTIFQEWESSIPDNQLDYFSASLMYQSFLFSEIIQGGDWLYIVEFLDKSYHQTFYICEKQNNTEPKSLRINNLYPNPSRNYFTLDLNVAANDHYEFEIRDLLGRSLFRISKELLQGDHEYSIPIAHLDQGVYILSIKDSISKKIISSRRVVKY